MREGTFQEFAAPPQQTLAALAFHAPAVGLHGCLLLGLPFQLRRGCWGTET
jgi:hypothetical protein